MIFDKKQQPIIPSINDFWQKIYYVDLISNLFYVSMAIQSLF